MKTEGRDLPSERHHPLAHERARPCFLQRGREDREIGIEFPGRDVRGGRLRMKPQLAASRG